MRPIGDYVREMFRRNPLDDATIERLLTGEHTAGHELLRSFVEDTHLAGTAAGPQPTAELTAMFADEFSTEKGDLLATAASNVPGPAPQVAGLPKRRKNMIELILSKLAAAGLAAKVGAATGALALTGTAAAATGSLPPPVVDAIERTGIEIPGGKSAEHRDDSDHRQDTTEAEGTESSGEDPAIEGAEADTDAEPAVEAEQETPEQAEFGKGVAEKATTGGPKEDGRAFGTDVSTSARETHQPAPPAAATDNPGAQHRPTSQPTAESNPGTTRRPAPAPAPTAEGDSDAETDTTPEVDTTAPASSDVQPTAESNPGLARRP